jgi:hypothetical protein
VSILSARGLPIEETSKLVGHSSITITESVCRKQNQTTIETGTTTMDDVFKKRWLLSQVLRQRSGRSSTDPHTFPLRCFLSGWGDSNSRPLDPRTTDQRWLPVGLPER